MRWLALSLLVLALILVPFFLFEDYFIALAARAANGDTSTWTAALIIAGLLSSDVILPVPSSIVSAAAGALLGFWRGAAVVWTAMGVSCAIGYLVGARSAGATRRFVGDEGLKRAAGITARYGDLAIVLCRPVPVLAEASIIFAGVTHMRVGRFIAVCAWSNLGIALVYTAIGAFSMQVESFLLAFIGAMVLPGLAALAGRFIFSRVRPVEAGRSSDPSAHE